MPKKNLINSTISFYVGKQGKKKKKIEFNVNHNLPEVPGLSLNDAVVNWSARTNTFTAQSLSDYINGKNTGFYCEPV